MAKLGEKLGKLSLAILENFVESKLGKKFVDELRAPTDEAMNIAIALEATEERFTREFGDKDLSKALFVDLKQIDRPLLRYAVRKFYSHPTDSDFHQKLNEILLGEFSNISEERANEAIKFYINILLEELALTDDSFRENVRTVADLRGERTQRDMANTLRRVENLLAINPQTRSDPTNFRALHQLPALPADFIGREAEIEQLIAYFRHGKGSNVSGLIGMGGIGKTTLGLIVAHQLKDQYADAQIFLDLQGTTSPLDPEIAMQHVILSFDSDFDFRGMNNTRLASAYQSALHDKRVLLFWDNARSAEQIKPLLPPEKCGSLITSRWTFALPGMGSHRIGVFEENEALAFLLDICPRIGTHAPALAAACGYFPLALRIVASFLAINLDWDPTDYLDRLTKQRLETLQAIDNTEPDVEATFELSYRQLTEDEQRKWRALSILPSSFNRVEASAIWDVDDIAAHDFLSRLCRYSILEYEENRGHYRLHDLLVEFAKARLSEAEKDKALLRYDKLYVIELQERVNELTFDIGRILHANNTTLLMVHQSLKSVIQTLSPNPFPLIGIPTTDEIEQILTNNANQLANKIEEVVQAQDDIHSTEVLPDNKWGLLRDQVSALREYKERTPVIEMWAPVLGAASNLVNQIGKEITVDVLPYDIVQGMQQTAQELGRITTLIDVLQTQTAVLQMEYTLQSLREYVTTDIRETKKWISLSIKYLIDNAIKRLETFAQSARIEIEAIEITDINVEVNEKEVIRAISNLLHNSIKYSWRREGGRTQWVSIQTRILGKFVYIEFENWGVPITREEIDKGLIFELGYRGMWSMDRGRLGTGIGLTDARRVAETYGGGVSIESHPAFSLDENHPDYYKQPFVTKATIYFPVTHNINLNKS
jgi:hypothetical protein